LRFLKKVHRQLGVNLALRGLLGGPQIFDDCCAESRCPSEPRLAKNSFVEYLSQESGLGIFVQPLGRAADFLPSRLYRDAGLDTIGRTVQVLLVFANERAACLELLKSSHTHGAPLSRRMVAAQLALVKPHIRSSNYAPVGNCAPPHECALILNVGNAGEDSKPPPRQRNAPPRRVDFHACASSGSAAPRSLPRQRAQGPNDETLRGPHSGKAAAARKRIKACCEREAVMVLGSLHADSKR
jgi:hypothetical protein